MIDMREKEYWLVMVVGECWIAGGLRVFKLLGMKTNGLCL